MRSFHLDELFFDAHTWMNQSGTIFHKTDTNMHPLFHYGCMNVPASKIDINFSNKFN